MANPPEPLHQAARATIPDEKLAGYALNPDHETGKHKARVFQSALGIGREDAEYLAEQIRAAIITTPVTASRVDLLGVRYEVRINIDGRNGATHPIVTGWFVESGTDTPPRLVTAYVDVP